MIAIAGLFVITTAVYLTLTAHWMRRDGYEASIGLTGVVGAVAVFFIRNAISGNSMRGAMMGSSLLNVLIITVTLGRPHDLFDLSQGRTRGLSKRERAAREARAARTFRAQAAFLTVAVIGAVVYDLAGYSFLD